MLKWQTFVDLIGLFSNGAASWKAYAKLEELNANNVSFVALTHPHLDHYLGLSCTLKDFKVNYFFSFPLTINGVPLTKNSAKLQPKALNHKMKSVEKTVWS